MNEKDTKNLDDNCTHIITKNCWNCGSQVSMSCDCGNEAECEEELVKKCEECGKAQERSST